MISSFSLIRSAGAQESPVSRPQPLGLAAFGLNLETTTTPPGAWERRPTREPCLQLRLATTEEIENNWSGFAEIGWEGAIDGARFVVERGVEGDHRFVHGAAVHHLSRDASLLRCAPVEPGAPAWWRVVLDSVLFTVALLQGFEALHAGAIATPDGVIAIAAASGGGKSTLLSELLGRGHALMADDVLVLESREAEAPLAHPAAPLMTLPSTRVSTLNQAKPPQEICTVGDEQWIAVPVYREPLPLKALVILDRRPRIRASGVQSTLAKIEDPLAPLLGSLMNFPRSPKRQLARFELASVLAAETKLWRLTADLDTSPEVLADTLLAGAL